MRLALRNRKVFISEKIVRHLMKEEPIEVCYARRKRKRSSYVGELIGDMLERVVGTLDPAKLDGLTISRHRDKITRASKKAS